MADSVRIRDYRSSDADDVNRIAVAAFGQFRDHYQDWPAMLAGLSKTSSLSATDLYYVRVHSDVSLGGVNSWFTRVTGDAEETDWVRSSLLTVTRSQ